MNKYLRKSLLELVTGTCLILLGYYLMKQESFWYKIAMTIGVIVFSAGVLTMIYRLIRKVDRAALLDTRKEHNNSNDKDA